ncbi:MAG TPA: response regulator transcription factor [Rhodanobacteraceae bacterium]|nr:response regulator transcription factor [Rhodanobacteraceae bacterium]
MIRLLLADDHTVLRECLVTALRASGDCIVVAEAGDGIHAIEQAHAVKPDVAIVDISMPRLNGIEVVRRLTTELPRTRVLVLTMHEEDEYVLQVVRAGASGYLIKHAATAELLEAIRAVAGGGVYFGPYATRVLAEQLQQPQRQTIDPYGALSPREREVLHLVVDGMTIKEIAQKLDISTKTAENHRGRVLTKLGVRNSAELVRYAMRKHLVD